VHRFQQQTKEWGKKRTGATIGSCKMLDELAIEPVLPVKRTSSATPIFFRIRNMINIGHPNTFLIYTFGGAYKLLESASSVRVALLVITIQKYIAICFYFPVITKCCSVLKDEQSSYSLDFTFSEFVELTTL
jgi:hypothetical protein